MGSRQAGEEIPCLTASLENKNQDLSGQPERIVTCPDQYLI
jgi:hypothetical protein